MDGLAGYTSSSSEDGENSRNSGISKGLNQIPSSSSIPSNQPLSAEKRQRDSSPYSQTAPTKRPRSFQESEPNNTNDPLKNANSYEQPNPVMDYHTRLIQSKEVDAGLKAQLSTLLGKVDQLLTNQQKVLRNQERLLNVLDTTYKSNLADTRVTSHIPPPSPVDNISQSTAVKQNVATQFSNEIVEFKVPALPSENNLLLCINSILSNQALAQSHGFKSDGQEPTTPTSQTKLFQEITLPGDISLAAVNTSSDSESTKKDDMPSFTDSDSDRMKDLLCWAQKIKSKSCSIGNFATNLVKLLFTKEEIHNKNCSGTRGKEALDPEKLAFVKYCTFRLYNKYDMYEKENIWRKKCVVSIDEYLRRGNRARANSRSVSQDGFSEDDDKIKDEQGKVAECQLLTETSAENNIQIVVIPTSVT